MPATRGVRKRNLANVSDQVSPSTAASAAGSSLPTLAALRRARASREALLRRVLPIGFGALVIVVVAEMFIGSTDGLGNRVFEAQQLFAMPDMYAAIFAAGALGYGLNLLFLLVERRFVHWAGK